MTQIDKNKYPAHSHIQSVRAFPIDELVIAEFTQLLAEHEALLSGVVVLEDGAEPEVGDLVLLQNKGYAEHFTVWSETTDWAGGVEVVYRGKPVIYKSTLNTVKENGNE